MKTDRLAAVLIAGGVASLLAACSGASPEPDVVCADILGSDDDTANIVG